MAVEAIALLTLLMWISIGLLLIVYVSKGQKQTPIDFWLKGFHRFRGIWTAKATPFSTVAPQVKAELLSLVNGDSRTADKLVRRERARWPGQHPERFYWDKAIESLQRRKKQRRKKSTPASQPICLFPEPPSASVDVQRETETKLVQLCHFDRDMALRLVQTVQTRNPGKSPQWCWEKAIHDIERDRIY